MEQKFRDWLVRRGNPAAATSYPRAIKFISEHYSRQTGNETDIYAITDQLRISEIAHDYSQSGRFSEFGYEKHSWFRAAIGRYLEFFSQHHDQNSEPELAAESAAEALEGSVASGSNFAYEKDLQTSLCAQVSELFPEYKIFGDNLLGVEYSIGGRRIDVLLEHRSTGKLLAVELKSGAADYRVFGQVCMYIGLLQAQFPGKEVAGVIVAGAIDSKHPDSGTNLRGQVRRRILRRFPYGILYSVRTDGIPAISQFIESETWAITATRSPFLVAGRKRQSLRVASAFSSKP